MALPFIAGAVVGAVAVYAFNKSDKLKDFLNKGVDKTKENVEDLKDTFEATKECIKDKKDEIKEEKKKTTKKVKDDDVK